MKYAPDDKSVVVAGGFQEQTKVGCNNPAIDIVALAGCHEEADCMNAGTDTYGAGFVQ